MARRERLTPTLFDQLVADHSPAFQPELAGVKDRKAPVGTARNASQQPTDASSPFARYAIPKISTFNINDLRASIRRELDDLLNTTALESAIDLAPYPEVRRSVLNYGLPDIAGRTYSSDAKKRRQDDITRVIAHFEPRLRKVQIEWEPYQGGLNEISFTIRGELSDALGHMPVRYRTKLEVDTAAFKLEG